MSYFLVVEVLSVKNANHDALNKATKLAYLKLSPLR